MTTLQQQCELISLALDQITGLTTPKVVVSESSDFVQHLLWNLFDSKILTQAECGFSPQEVEMLEREYQPNEQGGNDENDELASDDHKEPRHPYVLDLLGVYNSGSRTIVLYTELIWKVSRKRGIPFHVLKQLVLAHETAHAVTHLGKDSKGDIWSNFSAASVIDKEFLAQIYPHLLFRKAESGKDLGGYKQVMTAQELPWSTEFYAIESYHQALELLCETQPPQYGTWLKFQYKDASQINEMLRKART